MQYDIKVPQKIWEVTQQRRNTFYICRDDRDFSEGDVLLLREFYPCETCDGSGAVNDAKCRACNGDKGVESGLVLRALVTYVMREHPGITPGYVIMGLGEISLSIVHSR